MNFLVNQTLTEFYINHMNYTLTTPNGEKMSFYLLECAEIFRLAFGGTITPIVNQETYDSYIFGDREEHSHH